jgi:deoxyhypusine synthase
MPKKGFLVQTAFEHDVPVFCPAFLDRSAGFGLVLHPARHPEKHLFIDSVNDFKELTQIKINADTTGLVMIGGGVPKNFAQDTVICAEILGHDALMHKYAIQITVADSRDGACSWGKVNRIFEQMVYAEATSVLLLLANHAFHSGLWKKRRKHSYAKLFD